MPKIDDCDLPGVTLASDSFLDHFCGNFRISAQAVEDVLRTLVTAVLFYFTFAATEEGVITAAAMAYSLSSLLFGDGAFSAEPLWKKKIKPFVPFSVWSAFLGKARGGSK